MITVRPLGRPGDLGWIVQAHGELYAAEHGWDASFEALVARIVADFAAGHDPDRERGWIAELDGRRVGCVLCVADTAHSADTADGPTTARLRILLVHPDARGHGAGTCLVGTCVDFARDAGYRSLMLWTNDILDAARRIYEAAGFVRTASAPHHSFGRDLVGEDWALDL
ncbi:GNAT family N-acetyltransferase [Pseudonocardia sp.]|uniref:GNAT family N-acetyltransferase n=1 Tax=Pseudonocardia sp. TaxID=60912 RepID=UPI003D0F62D4